MCRAEFIRGGAFLVQVVHSPHIRRARSRGGGSGDSVGSEPVYMDYKASLLASEQRRTQYQSESSS